MTCLTSINTVRRGDGMSDEGMDGDDRVPGWAVLGLKNCGYIPTFWRARHLNPRLRSRAHTTRGILEPSPLAARQPTGRRLTVVAATVFTQQLRTATHSRLTGSVTGESVVAHPRVS